MLLLAQFPDTLTAIVYILNLSHYSVQDRLAKGISTSYFDENKIENDNQIFYYETV